MSKAISLKINDHVFKETEDILKKVHEPRNNYINHAISYYNECVKRQLRKNQFVKESAAVYGETLKVNEELEKLEDDFE